MWIEGTLTFDAVSGRWCIGEHDLHCGDCFQLYSDDPAYPIIPVRIEHNSSQGWYLISPYGLLLPSTRKARY